MGTSKLCFNFWALKMIWAASWENQQSAYAKTKTQISFAVTAKLISAFVFATRIVQFLFYLNPKFQASSSFLWLYSLIGVGPVRKPHCWFSHEAAHMFFNKHECHQWWKTTKLADDKQLYSWHSVSDCISLSQIFLAVLLRHLKVHWNDFWSNCTEKDSLMSIISQILALLTYLGIASVYSPLASRCLA